MRTTLRQIACLATAIALTLALPATGASADDEFAPVNRTGPSLSVPADKLAASLKCTANVPNATRAPVLLLAGTAIDSRHNYGWNWMPALTKAGIPWCASDVPDGGAGQHNLADEQTRAEYITYAIRTMHKTAKRKIAILGHSQGGSIMRWSLRFWPDTRIMVDDVIGIAPDNHGAAAPDVVCPAGPCAPAVWQAGAGTRFKAALNSYRETFAGISYTTIRSDQDVLVVPHETSKLSGPGWISNLRVQDRCPLQVSTHETIGTIDATTEAFAMDALNHAGPATLSRVSPAVCTKPFMSGVNPLTVATDIAGALVVLVTANATAPAVPEEPPLRCYTLADGCAKES